MSVEWPKTQPHRGEHRMSQIDELSAKARLQAAELNRTLDELQKLGVSASVCSVPTFLAGSYRIARVQLVLTDPPHKSEGS